MVRSYIQTIFLILTLLIASSCNQSSNSNNETDPNGTSADISIALDVGNATTESVEALFHPGVVGYGLLALDKSGNNFIPAYFGLNEYLDATSDRGGYVVIDELSDRLRSMTALGDDTELLSHLNEVNEAVSLIDLRNNRVQLLLGCALPDALSKWSGYNHNIRSGYNNDDSAQPLYACAPLRDDAARATWQRLMQSTAEFFSAYGDKVVFIIGNEPETYFGGDFNELYDLFETTASGLRAGNPNVKIGGLTTSHYDQSILNKAYLTYHDDPDLSNNIDESYFTSEIQDLGLPLIEAWLQRLQQNSLPIDLIQTKNFNGNPSPATSGFWVDEISEIESWLQTNPQAHSGSVDMFYTDFPGWHTVCAEDNHGDRESIWDSEYFPAWYVSTYIAMKAYQLGHTGVINNVEPLLAFLIEYGYSTFFHTSCETDQLRPAGFNGSISLNAGQTSIGGQEVKTYIPKPILNSLHLLTGFNGSLIPLDSGDRNVHMVASYDSSNGETAILISYFLPSALNYHTAGFQGYEWGQLFKNNYGIAYDKDELSEMTPNPMLQTYMDDPERPKDLITDLLQGPQTLNIDDLGVSPEFSAFLSASREAGMANQVLKEEAETGRYKTLSINLDGLVAGSYTLQRQVVDKEHGNANTHRYVIHDDLESAYASGGIDALKAAAISYHDQYGVNSTRLLDQDLVVTGEGASLELALKPNSVHLIKVTPQ
ncbi:MAG: hypothetical protein ABW104_02630 [Candidatus Thiodiazotropha sp. 6PLUC2]